MRVMKSVRFFDSLISVAVLLGASSLACESDPADDGSAEEGEASEDGSNEDDGEAGNDEAEGGNEEGGEEGDPSGGDDSTSDPSGPSPLGEGVMKAMGMSSDRYASQHVGRDDLNYYFMANGWGPNFQSQTVSWRGTSFTVESMEGSRGSNWEPASYPTVFCGVYSDKKSNACGLPAARSSISSLRTGWRWAANGNSGQYNAAYDVWMGNGDTRESFAGYFMVWLRDPPGQQPAGSPTHTGVTVPNVPGIWNVWTGRVNQAPIVNFVRGEGQDLAELEFDMLDFFKAAEDLGVTIPGTHVLSVAVGFEIWEGPVTNLESVDFYVDVN